MVSGDMLSHSMSRATEASKQNTFISIHARPLGSHLEILHLPRRSHVCQDITQSFRCFPRFHTHRTVENRSRHKSRCRAEQRILMQYVPSCVVSAYIVLFSFDMQVRVVLRVFVFCVLHFPLRLMKHYSLITLEKKLGAQIDTLTLHKSIQRLTRITLSSPVRNPCILPLFT